MKVLLALALMAALLALGNTAAAGGPCPNLAGKYKCYDPKGNENFTREIGQTTDASGITTYWTIKKDGTKKGMMIADGQKRDVTTQISQPMHRIFSCLDNTIHMRILTFSGHVDIIYSFGMGGNLNIDFKKIAREEIKGQYRITCQRLND